ncbi:hypothetical protein ACH4SP_13000 [Streptomyces sp. NPDC021093]|uniref:hypothetical protein n=1 Tax=Streptomyces sp. NPDC021093 TaxID=3365112 RepID=UPI0037957F50
MRALARLGRVTLTAAATLALVTGLSTGAQAATGDFTYTNVHGDDFVNDNPENGECFLLIGGAVHAVNSTDTRATVYLDRGCEEGPSELAPGTARDFGDPLPHSVMFG